VKNRIDMAADLGTDVIIMHLPPELNEPDTMEEGWEQLWCSLDELEPYAAENGVRIAIENGDFLKLAKVFERCEPDYVGLCYDSGHGNVGDEGLDRLEQNKDRLISLHLHDNDGASDQHLPLFSGTVDWPRLAEIIVSSAYTKWVNMETTMKNVSAMTEAEFLGHCYATGKRFSDMIDAARK
jgi:sugar phosphate isomerase/epimerase